MERRMPDSAPEPARAAKGGPGEGWERGEAGRMMGSACITVAPALRHLPLR